jgi:DNA-binding CsgD family transcriptional regulator
MESSLIDARRAVPAAGETSAEVRDLVRRLVTSAAGSDATISVQAQDAGDAVLLDVEVDGIRCLLIRPQPALATARESLSPREQEIARMIARGYPNKTIAAVLDISTWTVDTYLRRIFAKLGVSTRAAMVARLMEEGQNLEACHHDARHTRY